MSGLVLDKIEYLILLVAEFQNMKADIVKDMISRVTDEQGLSMQNAFDAVYSSRLFEKLNYPKTGLYFQSSGYVYSYLKDELDAISPEQVCWLPQ